MHPQHLPPANQYPTSKATSHYMPANPLANPLDFTTSHMMLGGIE